MKLIPMTDFVLEQDEKASLGGTYDRIVRYAKFLKRPLTLGMFLPCDEEGNILEEPKGYRAFMLDPCRCEVCSVNIHDIEQYQQAK